MAKGKDQENAPIRFCELAGKFCLSCRWLKKTFASPLQLLMVPLLGGTKLKTFMAPL